jgi:hypothetical protein
MLSNEIEREAALAKAPPDKGRLPAAPVKVRSVIRFVAALIQYAEALALLLGPGANEARFGHACQAVRTSLRRTKWGKSGGEPGHGSPGCAPRERSSLCLIIAREPAAAT